MTSPYINTRGVTELNKRLYYRYCAFSSVLFLKDFSVFFALSPQQYVLFLVKIPSLSLWDELPREVRSKSKGSEEPKKQTAFVLPFIATFRVDRCLDNTGVARVWQGSATRISGCSR